MQGSDRKDVYKRQDEVSGTGSRVAAVAGAYKRVVPFLKVVGGAVAHFCPAVSTVNPVSYTHLDVYKRQFQHDSLRRV